MRFTEEQELFRQTVRNIAQSKIKPRAAEIDETEEFPWDIVELFRETQLFSLMVPEEYGGGGGDITTMCLAAEEVGKVDVSAAVILIGPEVFALPLLEVASLEQQQRYFPQLVAGKLTALSLTEHGSGSDAASIRTRAVLDGDHYRINGTKLWTTNGDKADLIMVFAVTNPGLGAKGISTFIVPKGTPGLTVGKKERKMGLHGTSTVELIYDDVRVPVADRIGPEGMGFKLVMKAFDKNRAVIGAVAVGLAQGAFEYALQYAKERIQFGQPIAKFQAIQFMLADMATEIEAARQLVYLAAAELDAGSPQGGKLGSMAKYFASDVAMKVTTDALQILGGYGYMKDHPVERMMRDAKITQIFEGTNQIQRLIVARSLLGREFVA
jgi:alkylation response protein AidB-like acyl-CoA dehydrogenase